MKYFKITPKMIEGAYDVEVRMKDTIPWLEMWLEFKGKKFHCTKLGDEEWKMTEVDDWPFYELPKDFNNLK